MRGHRRSTLPPENDGIHKTLGRRGAVDRKVTEFDSMDALEALRDELLADVDSTGDLLALDAARVAALGKKGRITSLMKDLGGLDPEARRARGAALNHLPEEVAAALETRKAA